jgi:hypothetical protein
MTKKTIMNHFARTPQTTWNSGVILTSGTEVIFQSHVFFNYTLPNMLHI